MHRFWPNSPIFGPSRSWPSSTIAPGKLWRERAFFRLLNRMLFHAAEPDQSYRVLEHFYRLSPAVISRFYAAQLTNLDKLAGSQRQASGTDWPRLVRASKGCGMKRTAAVIGSGFGGLALAIRLQSAGIDTTIIEARDKPGGRAYYWEKDGHIFDAGPTVITDPACLRELWELTGADMARDVDLVPVSPFYRLSWPDGSTFDYLNDDEQLARQIHALEPADVEGYRRFLRYSAGVYAEGYEKLGAVPFLDFKSMLRAAPQLARYQAWRSVYSVVSRFVRNEKLRQALSFHSLLVGGNPMTTSAIYALIHKLERDGGVWFALGGTNKLVSGMVRHFERLGGTVRLGDPVAMITTKGDRASSVRTESGWSGDFDAVASNADVVRTYDMLGHASAPRASKKLKRKRFSPSLFVVHFSAEGAWPDVPHHSILFGPRYGELLKEIYRGSELPHDPSIYLHHPTATDPSMAPAGRVHILCAGSGPAPRTHDPGLGC